LIFLWFEYYFCAVKSRDRTCSSTPCTNRQAAGYIEMVFVVVQIRSLRKVIKPWYGCVYPTQVMLVDLYHQYTSGQLDSSTEVSAELVTSHMSEVTTCDNRAKIIFKIPPTTLTMVSGADENLVIYFMWPNVQTCTCNVTHFSCCSLIAS